jgi:hypothetical protein
LAKAVEQLIRDLKAPDSAYWLRHRLARALDADPSAESIQQLAQQLSNAQSLVTVYAQKWLPSQKQAGELPASDEAASWHLASGGRQLAYRPSQHAAPLLKASLDVVSPFLERRPASTASPPATQPAEQSPRRAIRRRLARRAGQMLTSDQAPAGALASCIRCHQGGTGSSASKLAWQQSARGENHGFSKFPHRTHFAAANGQQSCAQCHRLAEQSLDQAGSTALPSGLQPITKQSCSQCHQPDHASNSCLTCHQYHWQQP